MTTAPTYLPENYTTKDLIAYLEAEAPAMIGKGVTPYRESRGELASVSDQRKYKLTETGEPLPVTIYHDSCDDIDGMAEGFEMNAEDLSIDSISMDGFASGFNDFNGDIFN